MTSLKEQNEILYYSLLLSHLKEMFSVIYTPIEGAAIQNYSRLFRKPEGCFLNINESSPEQIDEALSHWGESSDIDLIVVSDGEQILGIGDQGVGSILISIAKLVIYTACAGIHPHRTLPVVLDCGTNNKDLLDDELYLGNHHERVRGEAYNEYIDRFITAARKRFPNAYLHCEDFGLPNARRILDQYRDEVPVFNDDVQGTAVITLAGVMSGLKCAGLQMKDVSVLCYGAGTAGTGIADMVCQAIAVESEKSKEEAARQVWLIDKPGLLHQGMEEELTPAQRPYALSRVPEGVVGTKLESVIAAFKPHVLIGTSTHAGAFTESAVKEMASHVERPIIFPLSNPTRLHEAVPSDLLRWTDGRALVATGSPFDPVTLDSGETYEISECNNSTAFPGIGLGAVLARVEKLTDEMLVAATQAIAAVSPALQGTQDGEPDPRKGLCPDVADVREISVKVAMAVVKAAVEDDVAREPELPIERSDIDDQGQLRSSEKEDLLEEWVMEQMWEARYRPLRRVDT